MQKRKEQIISIRLSDECMTTEEKKKKDFYLNFVKCDSESVTFMVLTWFNGSLS